MSAELLSANVSVTLRWTDDRPRFKSWFGAARAAEWSWLTAESRLPIKEDDVRVTGKGQYLKRDGSVGNQPAEIRFGYLNDVPEPARTELLAALRAVNASDPA